MWIIMANENPSMKKLIEEYKAIGGFYTEDTEETGASGSYWPGYGKYGRINISKPSEPIKYHEFMHMLDDYAQVDIENKTINGFSYSSMQSDEIK